ncbi:hypothetical protein BH09VER1_BH09VER1_34140 [soil metagenome]
MLQGVGHIGEAAVDARLGEGLVEELTGGADEGMASAVFGVAGLLANEDKWSILGAFSRNGLGLVLVKRARGAIVRGVANLREAGAAPGAKRGLFGDRPLGVLFGGVFVVLSGLHLRLRRR